MKHRLLYGVCRLGFMHGCLSRFFARQELRSLSDCGPLKQWTLIVSPFIKIKCHLHCNISVRPLDPHAFPGADRAVIALHGSGEVQHVNPKYFHVHYDEQSKHLDISSDENNRNISVEVTAPIKSDLHVVTRGKGVVKIQNMESDLCQVQTEKGDCVLQSVKAHKVQVQSSRGSIMGIGTIHGDVDISTAGDSSVDIKKIQGTLMKVSTEHGPIKVKAIYAESSSMVSSSGSIHIGHLHGEACVQSDAGDVTVDSSSGALTAVTNAGNIDVYVGQTGTAKLHSQQGAVSIRVPTTMKARVQLCGTSVDISSDISQETERHADEGKTVVLGRLNGGTDGDCWIKATADRSTVNLKTQSWFETLRLGS